MGSAARKLPSAHPGFPTSFRRHDLRRQGRRAFQRRWGSAFTGDQAVDDVSRLQGILTSGGVLFQTRLHEFFALRFLEWTALRPAVESGILRPHNFGLSASKPYSRSICSGENTLASLRHCATDLASWFTRVLTEVRWADVRRPAHQRGKWGGKLSPQATLLKFVKEYPHKVPTLCPRVPFSGGLAGWELLRWSQMIAVDRKRREIPIGSPPMHRLVSYVESVI